MAKAWLILAASALPVSGTPVSLTDHEAMTKWNSLTLQWWL